MARLKIKLDLIAQIFPEADKLPFLPRKKKKALKKKITSQLTSLLKSEYIRIIEELSTKK
jgi:hypothetical protein